MSAAPLGICHDLAPMTAELWSNANHRGRAPQEGGAGKCRLKKLLADAELYKAMLKELAEGNLKTRSDDTEPCVFCRIDSAYLSALPVVWPGRSLSRIEPCSRADARGWSAELAQLDDWHSVRIDDG
jgi:hypothetical protein